MRKNIKGYGGLDYIELSLPVRKIDNKEIEEVIDVSLASIEKAIAERIILECIPIRGAESKFLRKALGMSMHDFSKIADITAPGVLKWEKEPSKYIGKSNELAVRMYVIEALNIKVPNVSFSRMTEDKPIPVSVLIRL